MPNPDKAAAEEALKKEEGEPVQHARMFGSQGEPLGDIYIYQDNKSVYVYQDNEQFTVRAELPGLKEEEISLNGDTLTIRSKHEESADQGFLTARSLTLPGPVISGMMTVTYEDGVLRVVLPKPDEAKPQPYDFLCRPVRIKDINQQQSSEAKSRAPAPLASVPGNSFMMLCRAFSMISGGFLFGSGVSHNSLWGSILGTAVGIAVFAFNEVTVRRVEQ